MRFIVHIYDRFVVPHYYITVALTRHPVIVAVYNHRNRISERQESFTGVCPADEEIFNTTAVHDGHSVCSKFINLYVCVRRRRRRRGFSFRTRPRTQCENFINSKFKSDNLY